MVFLSALTVLMESGDDVLVDWLMVAIGVVAVAAVLKFVRLLKSCWSGVLK